VSKRKGETQVQEAALPAVVPQAVATLYGLLLKAQHREWQSEKGRGRLLDLELQCGSERLHVTVGATRQQPDRPARIAQAWPEGSWMLVRAGLRQELAETSSGKGLFFRLGAMSIEPWLRPEGDSGRAVWWGIGRHAALEELPDGRSGYRLDMERSVNGKVYASQLWWEPTGPETIGIAGQLEAGELIRVRGTIVARRQWDEYGQLVGRRQALLVYEIDRLRDGGWQLVARDEPLTDEDLELGEAW